MSIWTDKPELETRLKALLAAGKTWSQIVEVLGNGITVAAAMKRGRKLKVKSSAYSPIWIDNPELRKQAIALVEAGNSAAMIALRLGHGLTRNAIVSFCRRSGLRLHSRPGDNQSSGGKVAAPVKAAPKLHLVRAGADEPVPLRIEDALVTMLTVRDGMCRWPHGDPLAPDFHFCGHAVEGESSWCPHHRERSIAKGPVKPDLVPQADAPKRSLASAAERQFSRMWG